MDPEYNPLLNMSFSVLFLSGVQQNATSRVISPSEKLLQQVEPFNSHHKTKKLRLDESLSGAFIVILPDRFITSIYVSLMQVDSPKHVCLNLPMSSLLFLSLSFPICRSFISCLCAAPSVASRSGVGKEGASASGPRKAGQRKAPGAGGLKAPGAACLPACLSPLPAFSRFCCLNLSVKEPYIVLDICLYLYHPSV